ncbi:glycoside hydrolase family 43 protein [Pedobacter frigoris]|uniref:Beta-xylosidase n=1 Tax=Pedobacter frigoris TaxID=2571272 RepID=A0A4U1CML6_9SPHI|nr:glycoside hydrolase family 43 protein [Pedobacter frigoris]TKC09111.1 beta-xylosidase [Pedobacter frigoris]
MFRNNILRQVWIIVIPVIFLAASSLKPSDEILLADPTIFLDKGIYYLYGTGGENGFMVYQSTDLKKWTGPVGHNKGYALSKGESYGTKGFWAPQVFKHKGTYYISYTANEQIAVATSNSPLGPFKQKVLKPLSRTGNQIDPFIYFDTDGTPYLYHVKLQQGNRIFVVKMKKDLSDITTERAIECISGIEKWENTENTGWPVTEGPTVIKRNKLYYLIYSANDFRSKDYAVGYATSNSPMGPWKKHSGSPFISRSNIGLNGTGHGDLFKDKSGNYQYVMHVHHSNNKVSPRITALVKVDFSRRSELDDELVADPSTFKLFSKD